jgi:hypothetical protein
MRRLSKNRFRECAKIETERVSLMDQIRALMKSHQRLEKKHASAKNTLAMERISSTIGQLEDEDKKLAEKSVALWSAVLALDGSELRSPEILKEQNEVLRGLRWLDRINNRLALDLAGREGSVDSLMTLSKIRTQLFCRNSALATGQERYQWGLAELIARKKR